MLQEIIEQVSIDFPWYDALNALWKGNPSFAPKTILSAPGVDHAGGMAALTKGKGKQTAAPPPDSYDLVRDTENDVVNIVDDVMDPPPLTQAKGKERVPPLPSPDEPTASLDVNHSSHIPDVESPIHGTLFDNADDNMEMQQWDGVGELQDDMELADQEKDNTIQRRLSSKRPYSSPSPPPTYVPHTPNSPSCGKLRPMQIVSSIVVQSAHPNCHPPLHHHCYHLRHHRTCHLLADRLPPKNPPFRSALMRKCRMFKDKSSHLLTV